MTDEITESSSYRTLVKCALSLGLPGNLKKDEYVELLRLHRMGFHFECKTLAHIMKTKRQSLKKTSTKKLVKKRSVGRPRKSKIKYEELSSETSLECIKMRTQVATSIPVEKSQIRSTVRQPKPNSEVHVSSSSSMENIVYRPPIAKTTSALLRNMLLSTDRTRFNRSSTNASLTMSNNNNPYCNYYQLDKSKPLNLEGSHRASSFAENSSRIKWKNSNKKLNIPTKEIKSTVSGNGYLSNLQAFPDIPQLADVDINASFELDNSNYSINDQTDTETTMLCIDDSDTLSNESAENIEKEQQEFDQRWAMSVRMESGEMSTPFVNCETFNPLDDVSLLGPQDTALVQNDVIQNYIETNNVQFMQLPDSSCEVIRTLQYYESRLLTSPWSFPEHLQNHNESISNEQTVQGEQQDQTIGSNYTLAEFANMLPCPIAGCLWYSHSATLYVHLFTCHQEMIYYGNSIAHVFRCQDIQNFCFFTHLQFVQNTIYIITVAFDSYSRTFVATIQHVSSYGDNTSASQTTAILTTSNLCNDTDQHSWSGPVQPYSVPLDVLHADGRCLFIDPTNSEQMIINVNLTVPLIYSNDSMFACL
ncbi:uncharacterized protein LOC100166607 isoform X1 [Acyrthosiphon pisum]|uniref:Uncharacterized protein n=2 Tax=Acyrthosiphon pisum TaxID=7029 RepID=A0A8R2B7K3_ACYPI|nr:uncharacterized protein LOC100166607 isoform X1 [Acyrthosiphon pisum]|eukprot:XP_008185144.1 PREDICTED: uncharacterized protein LOC100166607 isoform X1 [Acyrthosiphon pisum]